MFTSPQLDFANPHNINHFYLQNIILIQQIIDLSLYDPNTFIGEGFKRTIQYESLITEQELLQKRNEFWETRTEGNWEKLKEVLNMDDENAKVALEEASIIMDGNNIQVAYDMFVLSVSLLDENIYIQFQSLLSIYLYSIYILEKKLRIENLRKTQSSLKLEVQDEMMIQLLHITIKIRLIN